MLRKDWKFPTLASDLQTAANARLEHHTQRLTAWKQRKEEISAAIRSGGVEISESAMTGYGAAKGRDFERGARVLVRNDLQDQLDECMEKLAHHTKKRQEYDGWVRVLQGNPTATLDLDMDDWLYFHTPQ